MSLAEILGQPAWMADGLCAQTDPDAWFPDAWFPEAGHAAHEARAVCRACPVLEQCREWAVTTDQPYGIWGDTSPGERQRIRDDLDLAPAPQPHQNGQRVRGQRQEPTVPHGLDAIDGFDHKVAVLDACGFTAEQAAKTLAVTVRTVQRARGRLRRERDTAAWVDAQIEEASA